MFKSMIRYHCVLVVSALLVGVSTVRADYIAQTVTMDQSNTFKDGVNYGSVLIEAYDGIGAAGGGLKAGEVRLTYTANAAAYTTIDKTFGIDHIGFNTNLSLSSGQISGPSGWKVKGNSTISAFGKFTWEVSGNAAGGSRPNPVTTLITGLGANATIGHFLFGSTGASKNNPPTEGSVYFAAHVAGFGTETEGGHFIGGSSILIEPPGGSGETPIDTPEPTALTMCGLGIGFLGLARAARRYRRRRGDITEG